MADSKPQCAGTPCVYLALPEELTRPLFEGHGEGMFITDPQGRYVAVNQRGVELTGYSRDEFLRMTRDDLLGGGSVGSVPLPSDDPAYCRDPLADWAIRRKDGKALAVEIRARSLPDGNVLEILRDAPERKRGDESPREREERYRRLVESMPDPVFICDAESRYLYVNRALAASFGATPGDIVGKSVGELFPPHISDKYIRNMQHVLRTQQNLVMEELSYIDGKQSWISCHLQPIEDQGGCLTSVQGVVRDITNLKEAERALRESEARLSLVFNGTSDMQVLSRVDADDRFFIEAANRAYVDSARIAFPGASTDFVGREVAEVIAAFDVGSEITDLELSRYRTVAATRVAVHYEVEMPIPGDTLTLDVSIEPVLNERGHCSHLLWRGRDISERKRSEESVRRAERLATTLNRISKGFLTAAGDEEIYDEVLRAVLEALGSPLGVFGHVDEEGSLVCPSMTRHIWSQCQVPQKTTVFPERTWGDSIWGQSLRTGSPRLRNTAFTVPEGHLAVGRCLAVPLVWQGLSLGLLMVANKPSDYTDEDVSLLQRIGEYVAPILRAKLEHQRSEKALRESDERLRQAVRVAEIGIFDHDHVADTLFWSPRQREIHGVGPEEPVSLAEFIDLVHSEDLRRVGAAVRRAHDPAGDGFWDIDYRIVRRDGTVRWVTARSQTFFDGEGDARRPLRTVGAVRDITDQQRAAGEKEALQAQLSQAQKMESVGRLAGGVAHDFNNMLSVILGCTEMVLHGLDADSPDRPLLCNIQTAAQRSADLTRQLLAFARNQDIEPVVVDLNETVGSMLGILRRLIGEDIDVGWTPSSDLWPVFIDPRQVDQVLANLFVNARDAITGTGKVTMETANVILDEQYCAGHVGCTPGRFVMLSVEDDGCGMDQETLAQVFEPFFTTKGAGQGTGLGLATVYGIVKQNDGFIYLDSQPGVGTRFRIYLPPTGTETTPARPEAPKQPAKGGREAILLVEDEPMVLQLTTTLLEDLGYAVLPASTPREAILLAEEHADAIDLILTDVVMPEMDGRELAQRVASRFPGIKSLFMSGYAPDEGLRRGSPAAGGFLLRKPFSRDDLAAKVREVLGKGREPPPKSG